MKKSTAYLVARTLFNECVDLGIFNRPDPITFEVANPHHIVLMKAEGKSYNEAVINLAIKIKEALPILKGEENE